MIRRRVVVSGRVQGVFYRARCAEAADAAGVAGWVANQPDGTVEVVLEGDEPDVTEMLAWCREGSERATVTGLDVTEEDASGEQGFEAR